ncbi:hypothetical protein OIU34_37235 [Pararhizobium sp. BT-229]|uniref:DUF6894 family protein n=1 Tax=Pararhizobium sp. BT-229 TaxID=2986923 RepID=UPI0021F7D679|nr:hypothetical protein [Pararhizobium sp. BT-229]MCV9967478.1 hypothetical protein [Pararhizobium sp. BT-229]
MSSFKFRFKDQDGDLASDESYEFSDLFAAIAEAKRVLGEMALDGLPGQPDEALAVEVLNSDGIPVARIGLTISVDFLAA